MQYTFTRLLLAFSLIIVSTSGYSQDDKNKKAPEPTNGSLYFQLVKSNGTDLFMVMDVPDPKGKPTEQTYTVAVPVTVTKVVDGKAVTVTEYRTETRTRMVRPTLRKEIPVGPHLEFFSPDGTKLTKTEVIGRLGMGDGKMVVRLSSNRELPKNLNSLLNNKALIMKAKKIEIKKPIRKR